MRSADRSGCVGLVGADRREYAGAVGANRKCCLGADRKACAGVVGASPFGWSSTLDPFTLVQLVM